MAWNGTALALCFLALPARAQNAPRFYGMSEDQIAVALRKIHNDNPSLQARIEAVSAAFLGIPFKWGPLGEGDNAQFDGDPLYSFKQLDCTTSVEEIMALSLTGDLDQALHVTLQKIRYKDGRIGFTARNHFAEADWVPNNIAAGFLKDITRDIAGSLTLDAHKLTTKREWYAGKKLDNIKGFPGASQADRERRLQELRALADQFTDSVSTLPYVPLDVLPQLLASIPSGTIANLVRADRPDKEVLVSHQVFLIDKNGTKYVREAAYGAEFIDVPALEYFHKFENSAWPLLGLNLNQIQEQNP